MLFLLVGQAAEMECELISERTLDGLAAPATQGHRKAASPPAPGVPCGEAITAIANHLKIGHSTLYRALKDDKPPVSGSARGHGGNSAGDRGREDRGASRRRPQGVDFTFTPKDLQP
jgi:hypothetical protein